MPGDEKLLTGNSGNRDDLFPVDRNDFVDQQAGRSVVKIVFNSREPVPVDVHGRYVKAKIKRCSSAGPITGVRRTASRGAGLTGPQPDRPLADPPGRAGEWTCRINGALYRRPVARREPNPKPLLPPWQPAGCRFQRRYRAAAAGSAVDGTGRRNHFHPGDRQPLIFRETPNWPTTGLPHPRLAVRGPVGPTGA